MEKALRTPLGRMVPGQHRGRWVLGSAPLPVVQPSRSCTIGRFAIRTSVHSVGIAPLKAAATTTGVHVAATGRRSAARFDRITCRSAAMGDSADVIPSPYDDDDDEDSQRIPTSAQKVAVIGAGPTGLLGAMYLARRGYNVQVFERAAAPKVSGERHHNYPIVLSSRALLAFRELKLETSFHGPKAPKLMGTWNVVDGTVDPGNPDDEHLATVLADRQGLVEELSAEAVRLYSSKIKMNYQCELQDVNVSKALITVRSSAPTAGASMQAAADRSSPGAPFLTGSARPAAAAGLAAGRPAIPDWDVAALEAAAAERGMSVAEMRAAAAAPSSEVTVGFDFLVGADGADSTTRRIMSEGKPRNVRDFLVHVPTRDTETFKGFAGLPQAAAPQLVPGFAGHGARQYLYEVGRPGAPRLELWVAAPGSVSGIAIVPEGYAWEPAALRADLQAASAGRLPEAWLASIAAQACDRFGPLARSCGKTVQCSQFHGPRMVLLGDAAHSVTNASRQGLNCAVESVRLLNVVLKITNDNLPRAGNVLTEVRGEDAHCMQMMEQMQRRTRPGLQHGDFLFAAAGWLSGMIWHAAALMVALLKSVAPGNFRTNWVAESCRDCRKGYNEVLKVLTRFAAVPVLLILAALAGIMHKPLQAFVKQALAAT